MKKNYLTIAAIFACCAVTTAQNRAQIPAHNLEKGMLLSNPQTPGALQNRAMRIQSGSFAVTIDPIEQILIQKGITTTGTNPQVEKFLTGVFQDSTTSVVSSTGTASPVSSILMGTTFDPKSTLLNAQFTSLVSNADSYTIDSVGIFGSYVKKTADMDTLYVWLVWGDTANTAVYNKILTSSAWVAPISGWRRSVIGPKLTGATGAAGNKVRAAAPATNMKLVKYVLQPSDSVTQYGRAWNRPIVIPFTSTSSPSGVSIPAGNIVSCFYTFVPGRSNTLNQPMYSFDNSVVPTINGFCAQYWAQDVPAANQLMDYQVDRDSWNMGIEYDNRARHGMYNAQFTNAAIGDLTGAASMVFNVKGNSTVGLNELDKKGFAMGQNMPNPYSGESKVEYVLAKEASLAVFTVTDVTGRTVSAEAVETTKGAHIIKIGTYAPGVYYYSLNIDGNVSTKKMIVH